MFRKSMVAVFSRSSAQRNRFAACLPIVAAMFWCGVVPRAAAQVASTAASDQFHVEKVELLDVATDRIRFAVTPSITSPQSVRVKMITFYGLRINRIPVFVPPVAEELQFQPGVRVTPRRPMQVTVYLRDLDTLQPLIDLLHNEKVHIEGSALVEAKLDLLPSLLLRSRTAHAPMRFEADLPLFIPGGGSMQAQAIQALTLAEKGRGYVQKTLLALLGTDATRQRLQETFGQSVRFAVARYELTDSNHNRYPVEKMGVAFRIGETKFVTVRELTEPWKFDAALALKLKNKELTLVKDSYDLLLWPNGSAYTGLNSKPIDANAVSSRRHEFRIAAIGDDEQERMIATETGNKATLVRTTPRASLANLAVLEFDAPPKGGAAITMIDRKPSASGYSALVAFRYAAGDWMRNVDPELVRLSARVVNGRLVMDDPIDSSAFGSPVFSDDGLVGVVQDETSAILLANAAAKLKLDLSPGK
jgi:hypothetical protein